MAKIAESKGRKDENSGFARLFGNQELGQLISRVQATVIRSGNELEHLIETKTSNSIKSLLSNATQNAVIGTDKTLEVVFKPKRFVTGEKGSIGDLAIFNHSMRQILLIEIKDGDTFDTKKSDGELASLEKFATQLEKETSYEVFVYFCSFNQEDKDMIIKGAKGRFSLGQIMTGRELCNLLSINYDEIIFIRKSNQPENLRFFVTELLKIREIRQLIERLLKDDKGD